MNKRPPCLSWLSQVICPPALPASAFTSVFGFSLGCLASRVYSCQTSFNDRPHSKDPTADPKFLSCKSRNRYALHDTKRPCPAALPANSSALFVAGCLCGSTGCPHWRSPGRGFSLFFFLACRGSKKSRLLVRVITSHMCPPVLPVPACLCVWVFPVIGRDHTSFNLWLGLKVEVALLIN